uniref:MPN domain-containing protein n=1 Tax=Clastoptera arizonana TaxID=38151 RepID=A0A1B6DL46_9HEMI
MNEVDYYYKMTGPSLSFLLADCEKSGSDQVGFLLGEDYNVLTKTVSDSEMSGEKMEKTIIVNSTMAINSPFLFCNNFGKVGRKNLKSLLGELEKDVVGWYSFRRNSNHVPLLRETLLHKQLWEYFSRISPCFLFCIVTASCNNTYSTHSYRYSFLNYSERFEPVSVSIINVGDISNTYRNTAMTSSSKIFQEIFDFNRGLKDVEIQEKVKIIKKCLQDEINSLAQKINEREIEIKRLKKEEKNNTNNCTDDESQRHGATSKTSTTVKPSFSNALKNSQSQKQIKKTTPQIQNTD